MTLILKSYATLLLIVLSHHLKQFHTLTLIYVTISLISNCKVLSMSLYYIYLRPYPINLLVFFQRDFPQFLEDFLVVHQIFRLAVFSEFEFHF